LSATAQQEIAMCRTVAALLVGIAVAQFAPSPASAQDDNLPHQAARALRKASDFFVNNVASHGGCVYLYSADLAKREGEGKAGVDTVWVQPPGTPTVGMAFLDAYELTGDKYLLDAARAAGECLIQGQLRSGGWDSKVEFGPAERSRIAYRVEPERSQAFNVTTFDDDKSQSAMRLLIRLDEALGFKDARVHEAIEYALSATLKAQYPNGAWPQRYKEFPDAQRFPVKKASYPESWSRTFPGRTTTLAA
jgi:hypothetical protein